MKKIVTFLVAYFILVTSFFAQNEKLSNRVLTVDDAVMLAADNNISLQRQKISVDLSKKRSDFSWNSVSPSIRASGSYSLPFDNTDKWTMGASVSLSMNLTPSLYTSIRGAKMNYEQGILNYEAAVRTVELNVRKLFYNLLYTKEYLNLLQRNMDTAKQRYNLNKDKYNRGQLSELDLFSSQYNYESMIPTFESAQISYDNSIASFKQTLGIAQNVEIELSGNLEDYDFIEEITIDTAIDEIPSVKAIQAQIDSAKNQLLATRFTAWGPSISLSYSYGKQNSLPIMRIGDISWSTTGNALGVSVSIPLDGYLPWSTGALSVAAQKATLKDLQLQLENQKTTAEISIQNSAKSIMQAQSQLDLRIKNVELAQKTYDMTLNAYNHGSRDLLTLQNAADSLMSAKINLMQQKFTLISAVLDLENTLGIPFGTLGTK